MTDRGQTSEYSSGHTTQNQQKVQFDVLTKCGQNIESNGGQSETNKKVHFEVLNETCQTLGGRCGKSETEPRVGTV
jgi:hypothetical protein